MCPQGNYSWLPLPDTVHPSPCEMLGGKTRAPLS